MIPVSLLVALAADMRSERPTATLIDGDGMCWRAVWLGGGRLAALGLDSRIPTVAEVLAMGAPVRVDDLTEDGRAAIGEAMVRRSFVLGTRHAAERAMLDASTVGEA
jgi:hypothetical protein